MSFSSRVSDCRKYIHIVVTAEITYELALQFLQQAYMQARPFGIRNFFFDMRTSRNIESTSNNYHLIRNDLERIGFDRAVKLAMLINLNDDSHDFVETVATSAGYNCKIFTCEDSLLEWIQI